MNIGPNPQSAPSSGETVGLELTVDELKRLASLPVENPNPILRLDAAGRILYANAASDALLRYWSSAIGELAPQDWREVADAVLASHKKQTFEVELEGQWYGFMVMPMAGMGYVNFYGADITERKQVEQALQESDERFRSVLENSIDAAYRRNLQTDRYDYLSPVIERVTGWSIEEMNSTDISGVLARIHPDDVVHVQQEIERTLAVSKDAGQATCTLEYRFVDKNGRYRWLQDHFTVLAESDGRPAYRVGIVSDITERQRFEQALQDSEQRYRSLFDEMTEGFAIHEILCDANGKPIDYRFLEVNPAFERLTGLKREDVVGKTVNQVLPDNEPYWVQIYGNVALTGQPVHFENYSAALRHTYEVYAYSPAPRQFAALFVNVTQRKQAEDRMHLLQELTSAFSQAVTPEQVASVIMDKAVTALGGHAGSVVALSEDGASTEMLAELNIGPELRVRLKHLPLDLPTPLNDAVRTQTPVWIANDQELSERYPYMVEVYRATTHTRALACLPLFVGARTLGGIIIHFPTPRQIDEDERAFLVALAHQCAQALERARLYEAEQRARQDAERRAGRIDHLQRVTAALSGALHFDEVADIILRESLGLSGASAGSVVLLTADGAHLELVRDAGYSEEVRKQWSSFSIDTPNVPLAIAVRRRESLWLGSPEELAAALPPGSGGIINTSGNAWAALPLSVHGRVIGGLGLSFPKPRVFNPEERGVMIALADQCAQAIERARLYEVEASARREAERANELKLKFLAMISHELRTPLASIKGFATTLLATDVTWDADMQRDFIQTIDEESDKLTDMIEHVLDLSRIEAGTFRIDPQPVPPDHILATVMPQLYALTPRHRLLVDVPEGLPKVKADRQRVAQVIANLVSNAAKYSPPRTDIMLSAAPAGAFVQFCVTDQGPGISEQDREWLFQAFRRGEGAHKRTRGVGLGLAICKGLVEAHGGSIWLQNPAGQGTSICFTLPVAV